MEKFQWVAYELDMFGYIIIETEAINMSDAHKKAVEQFEQNGKDFDTIEPFDKSFVYRMKWLTKG